jgi:hypothetical protein
LAVVLGATLIGSALGALLSSRSGKKSVGVPLGLLCGIIAGAVVSVPGYRAREPQDLGEVLFSVPDCAAQGVDPKALPRMQQRHPRCPPDRRRFSCGCRTRA